MANSLAGGLNSARWICTFTNGADPTVLANGTLGTNAGCLLLPFTPQPGAVYFMTASLTVPPAMSDWVAMGFMQLRTQTNNAGYARFTDSPLNGYAWMNPKAGASESFFPGPRTTVASGAAANLLPGAGTYTLEILLNTVGARWTVAAYVNGVISGTNVYGGTQLGTNYVYGTNPTIGFAGIGQNQFAGSPATGVQWNYWALSVVPVPTNTNTYWLAPLAAGTGDGLSAANAAGYLNSSFWTAIQSQLQSATVNINVLDGNYQAGTWSFADMGDPLHRLTLQAVNRYGPIFSTTGSDILDVSGSQNIKFCGIIFTGPSSSWGIHCQPDNLNPCRNIDFPTASF